MLAISPARVRPEPSRHAIPAKAAGIRRRLLGPLFRPDATLFDDALPFFHFLLDEGCELGRAHLCAPSVAKYFFTSSEFCTAVISVCSLSTIAAGVPAGATVPHQLTAS